MIDIDTYIAAHCVTCTCHGPTEVIEALETQDKDTFFAICPECANGKHPNCTHWAYDSADKYVACECEERAHEADPVEPMPRGG